MFYRSLTNELLKWKKRSNRSPLIVRGARQVGKTSLIRHFSKQYFDDFFEINFESNKQYKRCFNTLDPKIIIANIEKIANRKINIDKTILFLEPVQSLR